MLKLPISTAVDQVPDAEIAMCSFWLEAFGARASHCATISSTSLKAAYNFLQKVNTFFCASVAKDTIKNDASVVDDLLQHVNSTVLEAQLMSHDAGVTATELYTHLYMLRRRTALEFPAVNLPQRDKDRLLVMSFGGNDLFVPNARKVEEWKKDTEEEKFKLLSRVFEEREHREKALKKQSLSTSVFTSLFVPSVPVGCTALSEVRGSELVALSRATHNLDFTALDSGGLNRSPSEWFPSSSPRTNAQISFQNP